MLHRDPRWAAVLAILLLLPLIHLAPLPPAWWQALPGRDGAAAAMAASGQSSAWRPWSLSPDASIAAGLALISAIVMALVTATLRLDDRVRLIGMFAGLGMAAALIGVVQFIGGGDQLLSLYSDAHRGWAIGFFANRNAQADLVAIALLAVVLLAARHRDRLDSTAARVAVAGAVMTLLLAGLATGSRMGLAVLGVPVLFAVTLAGRRAPKLALALMVGVAVLFAGGTALDRVTARVHDAGNRTEIWGDGIEVARSVAPWGAGLGSFQPLYAAAERLDHVQPTFANRAHNDYLELAIEGGAPARGLLVAVLAFVAARVRAGWRDADPDRRLLARFAGIVVVILAVHSVVDYPLRNLTLLSVAGMAFGGLASAPRKRQERNLNQGLGDLSHA